MADREISELTAADALDGSELVHVDQDGNSRKATLLEIAGLATGAMLVVDYDPDANGIIAVAQGGTNAATASGARTNLGLGTMAVQNAGTVAITGGSVTGITDLTVADGGTGASDASGARTNLGLAIGTDVMAYSANLAGFAATTVANVQNRDNHTGTQLADTISDFSTAADLRIDAAVGASVQAYDALLDSVSALSLTTGDIIYATGPDAVAVLPAGPDGQVLATSGGVPAWDTSVVVGGLLAANNLSDVASADTSLDNLGFGATGKDIAVTATPTAASQIVVGDTHIDLQVRYGLAGDSGDNAKIQTALDTEPIGCILHFPVGVTSPITTELLMTRYMHLDVRGCRLRGDFPEADIASAVIKIRIADVGFTANRGMTIWPGNIYLRGDGWGGSHPIWLTADNTTEGGLIPQNFTVRGGIVSGGNNAAIRISGTTGTSGPQFSEIDGISLGGGVWLDQTSDGNRITNNTIYGPNFGINANIVTGAAATWINANAIVNTGGAIDIKNGSQINIVGNQIEQGGTHDGTSPKVHIIIRGLDTARMPSMNRIMWNNFGGGTNMDTSIYLVRANDTLIDGNSFKNPGVRDLLTGAETYNTVFGHQNRMRGAGIRTSVTDFTQLVVFSNSGVGTEGLWLPAASDWTFSNGSTAASLLYRRDGEMIRFRGNMTAGSLTNNDTLATLPVGFRPVTNMIVACRSSGGAGALLISTDGTIKNSGTQLGATVYMSPLSWPLAWKTTYFE